MRLLFFLWFFLFSNNNLNHHNSLSYCSNNDSSNHAPLQNNVTIILENWSGYSDKPLAVVVFTNDKSYLNKYDFSKVFVVENEVIYKIKDSIKEGNLSRKNYLVAESHVQYKITIKESHQSNFYFITSRNQGNIIFKVLENICNRSYLFEASDYLSYIQKYLAWIE